MTTTPEIDTDTDELHVKADQLTAQADALDAALAAIESLPGQVQSQASQFIADHEPNAVYASKLTELGQTNAKMKAAITGLAARLRKQATALTTHSTTVEQQQRDAAADMDKIPADTVSA